MVDVQELRKSYGSVLAVNDFTFSVPMGEVFGLLGPNGAGKTTTMHMIAGILRPDAGSVRINGEADPTRSRVRRSLGIAPQTLGVYGELTGEENLLFMGRLQGLARKALKRRVAYCLELTGLTDRRRDKVRTYSGGMKRRLNLACALVHDPKVILLDEPTVGVDPQSRSHILEQITQIKDAGRTIIYTTHYMEEAQRMCDRVAIVGHGEILALGSIESLIACYGGRSIVVAELARLPENVSSLPGTLTGTNLRFETSEPLEEVGRLAARGISFRSLHVIEPDLETVFLTLTGRSLRN
jgi:ABC-2 type transport system ATP-binding protein